MTLSLELGSIQDPYVRRALEQIAQHFPLHTVDMGTDVPVLAGTAGATRSKISWGLIQGSNGAKLAGTADFTSARTAAGAYTITWSTAKAGTAYAITVSTASGAGGTLVANYPAKVAASFGVNIFVATTGANADPADFAFVVIDAQ